VSLRLIRLRQWARPSHAGAWYCHKHIVHCFYCYTLLLIATHHSQLVLYRHSIHATDVTTFHPYMLHSGVTKLSTSTPGRPSCTDSTSRFFGAGLREGEPLGVVDVSQMTLDGQ
jgi:hypothetical protein